MSASAGFVVRRVGFMIRVSVDAFAIVGATLGFCAVAAAASPLHLLSAVCVTSGSLAFLEITERLRVIAANSVTVGRPDTGLSPAAGRRIEQWLVYAGALLPAEARDRYIEEWWGGIYEVLVSRQASRSNQAGEIFQCLRAALTLALVLRLRRYRASDK
ncbi:hypothetical protein AB0B85_12790 [Micromonospora sp. NPDC049044]|uniref:hypothetical protein n=1 Tax=Micromonospora sp. NPDC049044 TaxID=3154827 RepID=UPI0033C10F9F